ncbi:fatty-acid synthase [Achromatium sp. WMS3]|nr:fatty-acid synthase [Achromatium sp. WMS3]
MPVRDICHEPVKQALLKDGWIITHDPFKIEYGPKVLYADLGAEQVFAAEKNERKIVVEVKSFIGASIIADLEQALGQYILYADILSDIEPDRIVYLAIREEIFATLFNEPLGQLLLRKNRVNLLVFDSEQREIHQWIP